MKYYPERYNLFDDFFSNAFERPFLRENSLMKTDVHAKDGSYVLDIELPGYNKEDVKVELKEGYLTISASHNETQEEKDSKGNLIRQERYSGSCSRSFYVGKGVEGGEIKATFKNGILSVTVPDKEDRRIENKETILID